MVDVYRVPAERCHPACMHCMTSLWVVFDVLWSLWICKVCAEEWWPT